MIDRAALNVLPRQAAMWATNCAPELINFRRSNLAIQLGDPSEILQGVQLCAPRRISGPLSAFKKQIFKNSTFEFQTICFSTSCRKSVRRGGFQKGNLFDSYRFTIVKPVMKNLSEQRCIHQWCELQQMLSLWSFCSQTCR